jgi:uncharacterized membrane protein YcaP (DUF421 family)
MGKEDIHIEDFSRIFMGDIPWVFYIEVVLRALFIYLLLMTALRSMGPRMAATLSRTELVAMVSLAAAVGMPLLSPERGLLPGAIIAIVVVCIERFISYRVFKSTTFETIIEDKVATLVEDNVLQLDVMKETRITREFLFAQLRSREIMHLGEVKRFYIEANGAFTLVKEKKAKHGLSIIPECDPELYQEQESSDKVLVCKKCGYARSGALLQGNCEKCHGFEWVKSIEAS